MTEKIDIHRTANLLIHQHAADAPIYAAMKVDKMLASGDMDRLSGSMCCV